MTVRVLIVESRYYVKIADELLRGARAEIEHRGARHETVIVPGTFEIPAAIRAALDHQRTPSFDAYVALGCVIRGETDHYQFVAQGCVDGLMDLVTRSGVALGFGVLTCETMEQALERAAVAKGNKGAEAARAALDVFALRGHFANVRTV